MKLIKRAWLKLPPLCKSLKIEAHLQILACTCFFQSTRSGGASCECFRVTQVADMCVCMCVCDCSPCFWVCDPGLRRCSQLHISPSETSERPHSNGCGQKEHENPRALDEFRSGTEVVDGAGPRGVVTFYYLTAIFISRD